MVRSVTSLSIGRSLDDVFRLRPLRYATYSYSKLSLSEKGFWWEREIGSVLDFYKNYFQKSFVSHF